MKQLFSLSIVLAFAFQSSAFAESSTTTATAAADAPNAATAALSSSTATAPKQSTINIKYVGVFEGPGLSGDAGKDMHNKDEHISNRPTLQYNFNRDISAGLQTRIATTFKQEGIVASNETWRLYGTFKNVASYGVMSLDILPRVMLPTSKGNHNNSMMPSPELLAAFNINPKDSRFSFDYTPQLLGFVYSDNKVAAKNDATTLVFLHNIEGSYQLSSKTQLTFGWYPEYVVTKSLPYTNDSNEVDVGVSVDVAKGWSINPYLGMELNGMGANGASIGKNMEAALIVSGTFL